MAQELPNHSFEGGKWHCLTRENPAECSQECYLRKALNIFGKKYSLLILRFLLLNGAKRFNEILNAIKCSPKTLSHRLKELEMHGLIRREISTESPIRVEYSLTPSGLQLDELFEHLSRWAKAWLS
ncbi:MAG: winged helix-turn-helix transcriptional regulator [Promethearchaeota archaeon]